ncbi:MAG: hypothetical protein ACXQS7_05610 [Candidatus Syntropharchaeia archaeon]
MVEVPYDEVRVQGTGDFRIKTVLLADEKVEFNSAGCRNISIYVKAYQGATLIFDSISPAPLAYGSYYGSGSAPDITMNQTLGSLAADGTFLIDLTGTLPSAALNFQFLRFRFTQPGTYDIVFGGKY